MPNIHVILVTAEGTVEDTVARRNTMGQVIGLMAKSLGESLYFHGAEGHEKHPDYKTAMRYGGALMFVECSDALLMKISTLPGISHIEPLWQGVTTQRSQKLQDFFMPKPQARPRPF